MQTPPQFSLIEHFKSLPDPRGQRTKEHDLVDVLTLGVRTLLCAGESVNDMEDFGLAKADWCKTFRALRHGIPSHDTFNRVFAALDPQHCGECFMAWTPRGEAATNGARTALSAGGAGDRGTGRQSPAPRAAENLATRRRLALNRWKQKQTKPRGSHGKQLNASWDHAYLLRLLGILI